MYPTFVIAGRLRRDYLLPPVGRPLIDVPAGDLLYAAAGLAAWEGSIGLLARVGEDYPHEWLHSFEQRGLDTRGIRILLEHLDLRFFQAYLDPLTPQRNNPVAHFARLGLTYPKALLGYQPPSEVQDNRKMAEPASPRPADIPEDYLNASAVHLCPLDYLTHNRLIPAFRQGRTSTLTLDPSAAYMTPATWLDVRRLLHGLTAFLPSEEELRALFWGASNDLWEMAEELAAQGCELIVIKRGGRGQMLYDAPARKRWEIPAYPAHLADPSGAGDSFCGGFLAGCRQTYDPLRAVLYGNVSASLTIEGSGAFHALDALPGLAQARLQSLAEIVRQV
ncbi:MAG: carbohydrate kinase family protein [Anaerolineales bacterium]|nr:carbohydrate kinase family protein [Anaerolineales bacterium]